MTAPDTSIQTWLECHTAGAPPMVYLDHAASTPPLTSLRRLFPDLLATAFANPAATHRLGHGLKRQLRQAASRVLDLAGIPEDELDIVWTSGGTEANNLALRGALAARQPPRHVLQSAVEHPSVADVLDACPATTLEQIPVDGTGRLRLDTMESLLIDEPPDLISICHVQNELGTRQDLAAIRALLDRHAPRALFHADAMQSFAKLPVPWREARLDLLTVSGHKLHGPAGVGALLCRRGTDLVPQQLGGGQQDGLRSGSLDAAGILAFCHAAEELLLDQPSNLARVASLHASLRQGLATLTDRRGKPVRLRILSPETDASPYILTVAFAGYQGAVLMRLLGEQGVIVGTGSACAAEKGKPSDTMQAIGLQRDEALGVLRFSFGVDSQAEDVEKALAALQAVLQDY